MADLTINITNGDYESDTSVYAQKDGQGPTPIPKGTSKPFTLGPGEGVNTWAEKNGNPDVCSLKFHMKDTDLFRSNFHLLLDDGTQKKWRIENPSSGQTAVNVTVGPDGQ